MATAQFLSNTSLWREIQNRVTRAKMVRAAVAYFGQGAARLLPLQKGHKLVVDMSMGAVKQGVTDPKEIRTLLTRGVVVYTRGSLHAKFLLADSYLIASSANISNNSKTLLDEAGIITNDTFARARATRFFDDLCTEPVRPEYLRECIKAYRPPEFKAAKLLLPRGKISRRVIEAKLWFVGGLIYSRLREQEQKQAQKAEEKVERRLKNPDQSHVDYIHYPSKPAFFRHIRTGAWVVCCIADVRGRRLVDAPQQVPGKADFSRGKAKRRFILLLETSNLQESFPLSAFRKRIGDRVSGLKRPNPRTKAIASEDQADAILRLWTRTGKISKKRGR